MDNYNISQKEEIEVLTSIYGSDWCVDNEEEGLYHITIEDNRVQLTLLLEFPKEYPNSSPPYFKILSSSLRQPDIEDLTNILQNLYLENIGETIVFQWVERIREWVQTKTSIFLVEDEITREGKRTGSPALGSEDFVTEEELNVICAQIDKRVNVCEASTLIDVKRNCKSRTTFLSIIHGDPITFKKSTFQGHAAVISDPKDANVFLRELIENKKIAHATHNIQAYRIRKEKNNTFDEHFEDDGEKHAGHRLLHLMQMMNVHNVIVVVSRWYGGVHLGPDRFRLINNAARQVLEKGNLIPPPEGRKKK